MSQIDIKTRSSDQKSSHTSNAHQMPHISTFLPRRRPRGNTFGMPGPDMGNMPASTDESSSSHFNTVPDRSVATEQHQHQHQHQEQTQDFHGPHFSLTVNGEREAVNVNEDHTFGVNMSQLTGRRSRADSYASTASTYSFTYSDAARTFGDGARIGEMPVHQSSFRAPVQQRDRSSTFTAGTITQSMYEEGNQDGDRTSMLTTNTALNFANDWAPVEPRGSIASLTFGPSASVRRISATAGGGIKGLNEGVGVDSSAVEASSISGGVSTSVSASVDPHPGVTPSPTSSLSQSNSHDHGKTIRQSQLFSRYKHSPRPSIESFRSDHGGRDSTTPKLKSESPPNNSSGILPASVSAAMRIPPKDASMSGASASVTPTATTPRQLHKSEKSTSSANTILVSSLVPSVSSFKHLPSSQARPRPNVAHVIHRSDSLEKLSIKRRSTVSSIGSASVVNPVTLHFSGVSNATRTSGGEPVTPSVVVKRPRSATGSVVSRLAIGVSQKDRWEREAKEKGKEKELLLAVRVSEPSEDHNLRQRPRPFLSPLQQQQTNERQLSVPSSEAASTIVSPSGSVFIESFHSPTDATFHSTPKPDTPDGSLGINVHHAPPSVSTFGPLGPSTTSAPTTMKLNSTELSSQHLELPLLNRTRDRRHDYVLGPENGGRHFIDKTEYDQEGLRSDESDDAKEAVGASRDETIFLPRAHLSPLSYSKSAVQEGISRTPFRNEEKSERSFVPTLQNGANVGGSERIGGGGVVSDGKMRNAMQPHHNANANASSSGTTRATLDASPNHSSANYNSNTPDFLNLSFPSPFLSFSSATTPSPTTPAITTPTRRLLHSFSQPSLRSFVQNSHPFPSSHPDKVDPPPSLPNPSASTQPLSQIEGHPYAMYGNRNYPSASGAGYQRDDLATGMQVGGRSVPNPNALLNVGSGNNNAPHPYSHAYQDSIQARDSSNTHHPTLSPGPYESRRKTASSTPVPVTNSLPSTSASGQGTGFQATSSSHGFKRTLRSSFKLPGSSRPSSTVNTNVGDAGMLNASATIPANVGGSLRSSIRTSVSTPNLRSLFKFGHSHDNKAHEREAADGLHDANAKGKQPALPTPTTSGLKRPTTPKKTKHPKTQYSAETWCDALLFPRPRFRAHVTSPPASPIPLSALNSADSQPGTYPQSSQALPSPDRAIPAATTLGGRNTGLTAGTSSGSPGVASLPHTPPRESRFMTDSPTLLSKTIPAPPKLKAPPKGKNRRGDGNIVPPLPGLLSSGADEVDSEVHPMLSALEQVLIEGEIRNRERQYWSEIATSSFQNRRSRSLSRSRKRAGTTSTMTSTAPSSENARGRGRNLSDAAGKSEERTHGTTSSISKSLVAGLSTIAAEAFRQPTPTISTISHHGHGLGENHQTVTMTTDSHSHSHHSRTTSESGPASQRQGHSHARNTSWGKAALKTLCGSASEDEDGHRPSEDDGTVSSRGRSNGVRGNGRGEVLQQRSKAIGLGHHHEGATGTKVKIAEYPVVSAAKRSLSPDSNTSEPTEVVIAVSTPPPQLPTPNDSIIEIPNLYGHPYAQSRTFPASAPYAGPYPSSRDYKPLYTPRHNADHHRLHSSSTFQPKPIISMSSASIMIPSAGQRDNTDSHLLRQKETDPTPYAYANIAESNKRESTLGVEEALMSSSSFRRFVDAILEDDKSGDLDVIDVLAETKTPTHSPRGLDDGEEQQSFHPVLREVPALSTATSSPPHTQYVRRPQLDPTTSLSSPSSHDSSYSGMSRPFSAVDDLEQFRDLFFKPLNSPLGDETTEPNNSFGSIPLSPTASSPKVGSGDLSWSTGGPRQIRAQVRSPSLRFASPNPVDYTVKQDFPEDIESSRASSVLEHDFEEDIPRLGTVPPSVPVMTESGERRQSTTLSYIDNAHNRDTIMSTASAYSLPSIQGHGNELRESFVTNTSSSTSGVTKLLGNFPAPPPPSNAGRMGSSSRPDSYHFLGLAESQYIIHSTSSNS